MGLSSVPEDNYECRYCQIMYEREKSVACNDNAIAAGRVAGVDPIQQIIQRCIRIVKTSTDISSCVLCKLVLTFNINFWLYFHFPVSLPAYASRLISLRF